MGRQQIGAIGSVIAYVMVGLPASFFLSQDVGLGLGLSGIWLGGSIASVCLSLFNIAVLTTTDWKKMATAARVRAGVTGSASESGSDWEAGSNAATDSESEARLGAGCGSGTHLKINVNGNVQVQGSSSCELTPIGSPDPASDAPLMQSTERSHGSPLGRSGQPEQRHCTEGSERERT